jgi:hypothetical protein
MLSESEYESIVAEVDCGELTVVSQLKGNPVKSRMSHDEEVSDWSDAEIRQCVVGLLMLEESEEKLIQVNHL